MGGLYRDNGKENGNYLGFRVEGVCGLGGLGFSVWGSGFRVRGIKVVGFTLKAKAQLQVSKCPLIGCGGFLHGNYRIDGSLAPLLNLNFGIFGQFKVRQGFAWYPIEGFSISFSILFST